jgi:arginine repressor
METGIYKIRKQQNKHYYAVIEDESVALHPVSKTKADG